MLRIVRLQSYAETRRGMRVVTITRKRGASAVDSRLLLTILALVWQSKAF